MTPAAHRVGLADILRRHESAYLATHDLSAAKTKVWRAIVACRTAALGGHVECCDTCGTTRHVYHSCRNRHCPLCQTRAKEAWLAARQRELLPTSYFHLVFTLPHDLHGMVTRHPRLIYDLLFKAASGTLTEFAASARHLGGEAAYTLVLHTWKQDLGRHVHVHALVAGGALTPAGEWVRMWRPRAICPKRGFLFPVRALSKVFRGKFVAALTTEWTAGNLSAMTADSDWQRLKATLYAHEWVVYAKQPLGGPAQVLAYLARYTLMNTRWRSGFGGMRPAERNARCVYRLPSSSTAFSSMCCRPGSSASAITVCWRLRASPGAWRWRGRRSMRRYPIRR